MYKYIGGISPDENEPGFAHTILRPAIDCGMESASAEHESMYGTVKCYWANRGGDVTLNIKVPVGCHATIYLPRKYARRLYSDGAPAEKQFRFLETEKEYSIELESGEYSFSADMK